MADSMMTTSAANRRICASCWAPTNGRNLQMMREEKGCSTMETAEGTLRDQHHLVGPKCLCSLLMCDLYTFAPIYFFVIHAVICSDTSVKMKMQAILFMNIKNYILCKIHNKNTIHCILFICAHLKRDSHFHTYL